jgi:hypothetical protein
MTHNATRLRRRVKERLAALASVSDAEWSQWVQMDRLPEVVQHLHRIPPRHYRLLAVRRLKHGRVEVILSRVLIGTFTAARTERGWFIDPTGRETVPGRMPLRLAEPLDAADGPCLARQMADVRTPASASGLRRPRSDSPVSGSRLRHGSRSPVARKSPALRRPVYHIRLGVAAGLTYARHRGALVAKRRTGRAPRYSAKAGRSRQTLILDP